MWIDKFVVVFLTVIYFIQPLGGKDGHIRSPLAEKVTRRGPPCGRARRTPRGHQVDQPALKDGQKTQSSDHRGGQKKAAR
jgi:hypothetical protein